MRYAATNYMGQTPARSYQDSKIICLNLDSFFLFPPEIRRFIALHEEGHMIKDTDSEIEADNYAFKRMSGKFKGANLWSVLAISRVLPFTTKEQYLRLLNMYKNALENEKPVWREGYELTGSPAYEYDNVIMMIQDAEEAPEEMFNSQGQRLITPIGPYVDIAHEVWTRKALGMPLNGYDQTILEKYPMPDDFEAYMVKNEEITDPEPGFKEDHGNDNRVAQFESVVSRLTKKTWFWLVLIIAILLIIIISKK